MGTTATAANSTLGLAPLHGLWHRYLHPERGASVSAETWALEQTLLAVLQLNVLETSRFLMSRRPSFEEFEAWIVELNGGAVDPARLNRLQRALSGEVVESEAGCLDDVEGLSADDLAHWDEHGYVIVKNAVSQDAAHAAEAAIYEFLGASPDDPESWYTPRLGHSIWVPLLRHPAMVANRRSPRLVKAFAQLWGREDLWANVDQGGLNPPEREVWKFPGPHLHWDTTLAPPHHFGVQGILYLADVAENQGAFSCVPGFHRTLQTWLDALPAGADPHAVALRTLSMKPIAADRGAAVLWHQSLPHGSSPNRAHSPRVAQYLQMWPTRWSYNTVWR